MTRYSVFVSILVVSCAFASEQAQASPSGVHETRAAEIRFPVSNGKNPKSIEKLYGHSDDREHDLLREKIEHMGHDREHHEREDRPGSEGC